MANETRQSKPWQAPVLESADERRRREDKEQQARYLIEIVKTALREIREEGKSEEQDFLSALFGGK